MQPYRVLLTIALALACGAVSVVWAAGSVGGSVDLTSDYIYHGLSESQGDPALQADIHYRTDFGAPAAENFIGLWGSTISRAATGGSYELNAYLGRTFLISSNSSATLSYVHYAYPDDRGKPRYDYDEFAAGWAFQDRVFATVAWTPDTARYSERGFGRCCRALSYDIAVHQSLGRAFTLSAALGYDDLNGAPGYAYWNGGVAYAIGSWQLDLSYFAMQPHAAYRYGSVVAGDRLVGTLV
ncbi:MAG TPA: TorF family putative porin, partial [Steroidobacteraceae bacterium]